MLNSASMDELSCSQLFWVFAKMSLMGFGGVGPWAYLTLVERLQWMSPTEYSELLATGQILPGGNIVNLTAMFGYRKQGLRGAFSALAGLLFFPFLITLGLGILYDHFSELKFVQGSLRGMSAASAGMVAYTGVKLARGLPNFFRSLTYLTLALIAVGILRFSLPLVVLLLGAGAIAIEWRYAK